MQWATSSWSSPTPTLTQATRVLPDRAVRLQEHASNDDSYHGEHSLLRMMLSVLANVIGGAVLLGSMFALPHIIERILS